jgi:BirA family biotin operon repressor/biotin-[acetyl-CoA-carboxylase] ligase
LKKSFEKKSFIGKYLHLKTCSSTQDVIRHIGAEWALIRADRQSAGRGRNDGRWLSQPGGLYYSLKLPQDQLPKSSAVLLLAVASIWIDVLECTFPSLKGDFSIKWPNDLLLSGKKLAGIIGEKRAGSVFLGVGLNVNNDLPKGNYKLPPISLRKSIEAYTDVNPLLMSWYRSFVST